MSLIGPTSPESAAMLRLFELHHREICKAAIRGPSDLIDGLFRLRRAAIARRGSEAGGWTFLHRAQAQLAALLPRLSGTLTPPLIAREDLQHALGAPTPLPRGEQVLRLDLGRSATETILRALRQHGARRRWVGRILSRSRFVAGYRRYRTTEVKGVPHLVGEDGDSVLHLSGIAHELGHCLHESVHGWSTARSVIISEACAHYLEDLYVKQHLAQARGVAPGVLEAWCAYQRRVDLLNLHFFGLEYRDIVGTGPQPAPLFEPCFCVFRESYFVNPGFQAVLALASLLRRQLHQAYGPDFSLDDAVELITAGRLVAPDWVFPDGE